MFSNLFRGLKAGVTTFTAYGIDKELQTALAEGATYGASIHENPKAIDKSMRIVRQIIANESHQRIMMQYGFSPVRVLAAYIGAVEARNPPYMAPNESKALLATWIFVDLEKFSGMMGYIAMMVGMPVSGSTDFEVSEAAREFILTLVEQCDIK